MYKIFFFDVNNTVANSKILIISSVPIRVIFTVRSLLLGYFMSYKKSKILAKAAKLYCEILVAIFGATFDFKGFSPRVLRATLF